MVSPKGERTFNPNVPLLPVEPADLALVQGDRTAFSVFLEPFSEALHGQPARLITILADDLFAFYVADTLAYLTRMLPQVRRGGGLRLRAVRRPGPGELHAPDLAAMEHAPQQVLADWAAYYRGTGGALLLEGRAIFRHLSVPQALRAQNLDFPPEKLMDARFAEDLPTSNYLQDLIVSAYPSTFYWDVRELAEREESCRQAFLCCLVGLGVRFLRSSKPDDAERLHRAASGEGMVVADSLMRMLLPIDLYRKRRLEAAAIFHDVVAPHLLSAAS